ncbi:hypothetical protein FSB78_02860 [Sphingomonas ginsenosidivorax]|uniref:Colicin transporter n=1 Tax=Sphingomonas ginsenosidivorax TaxID=862135 RepID=A0A5C6UB95_9SPHN|nr:hypothetical protein [Sphingomonas ginsenosidivorax]TXC70009.1 hypothetical protein FSB78_02860 [Sphingomonas ginsenosidivorax]
MTAAYRLRGVGWFGGCVAVVLGFYLVSLQVAAERKKLEAVNGQIRSAERDIRALETEFDTRGNLAQLERWNGDTLALSAPVAGQFVTSESALAAIDVNQPLGGAADTRMASLLVPSMPVTMPQPTAIAQAQAAPQAAPQVMKVAVQTAANAALKPAVIHVSTAPSRAAEAAIVRALPQRMADKLSAKLAVAKVRPQAVAMLDDKLLSDNTLGDILSGARAEARRRR